MTHKPNYPFLFLSWRFARTAQHHAFQQEGVAEPDISKEGTNSLKIQFCNTHYILMSRHVVLDDETLTTGV